MYFRFVLETNIDRIAGYFNIVYSILSLEILNKSPAKAGLFYCLEKGSCPAAGNQAQHKTNTPNQCMHVLSVFFSPG